MADRDLVTRLRAATDCGWFHFELFRKAADEIYRLQSGLRDIVAAYPIDSKAGQIAANTLGGLNVTTAHHCPTCVCPDLDGVRLDPAHMVKRDG